MDGMEMISQKGISSSPRSFVFFQILFTPSDRRYIQHPWLGNRWYLPYVLSWRWRDSNVDIPWAPARWHSTIVINEVIYNPYLMAATISWVHNWGYFTHRNGVTWAGPLLITRSGAHLVECIINTSSHLAYLIHLHCILKLQMDILGMTPSQSQWPPGL